MSSKQRWRLYVTDLETSVRLGIYPYEKTKPQRIIVNTEIEAEYALRPESIDECFNYDVVYDLAVNEWPKRPHVDLLETLVIEMLEHIFSENSHVTSAKVRIDKPDVFKEARSVGAETFWTREDYK